MNDQTTDATKLDEKGVAPAPTATPTTDPPADTNLDGGGEGKTSKPGSTLITLKAPAGTCSVSLGEKTIAVGKNGLVRVPRDVGEELLRPSHGFTLVD